MTEKQLARVLDWVNRQRAEVLGKPPLKRLPKGYREECEACPIAQALRPPARSAFTFVEVFYGYVEWGSYAAGVVRRARAIPPRYVTDFVAAFDNGDLPQFDRDPGAAA